MAEQCDVVIAGAGPAGSATALRLARAGLQVRLVERSRFPRDKACSEYMSPEGVRQLAALGVLGSLERLGGHPIRGTTVHAPLGATLTGLFARAGHAPFRDTGLSVPRRLLDDILARAAVAAGAELLEQTAAVDLLRDGEAVRGLRVRDAAGTIRDLPARLTIGADGLRSVLARALGVRRAGALKRYALAAHLAPVPGLLETAELFVSRHGYVGLNPLGDGLANVTLVLPAGRMPLARGRAEQFFFAELRRYPKVWERVGAARLAREVLVTGPFASWSRRATAPGALLVGDAADFFDPFTGEGICAALRGAELVAAALGEPLTRGASLRRALGEYERTRWRAFAGKWAVERAIGYAMLLPAFFDRAVARLERRGLAHTLIGVTGDFVPARAVLNPVFLSRVVF